jgi:hypothetical protein
MSGEASDLELGQISHRRAHKDALDEASIGPL